MRHRPGLSTRWTATKSSSTNTLYSGSLLDPIDIDQSGNTEDTGVWTGSLSSGTAAGGINDLGQTFTEFGDSALASSAWITDSNGAESDNDGGLYALSSVITVGSSTPEPGTMFLMPGALLLVWGMGRKRFGRR
jgi:hypothetical protein